MILDLIYYTRTGNHAEVLDLAHCTWTGNLAVVLDLKILHLDREPGGREGQRCRTEDDPYNTVVC